MRTYNLFFVFLLVSVFGTFDVYAVEFADFQYFGFEGKGPGEFIQPEDIVRGPKGEIVVADTRNHRIQIFKPDGTFERFITLKDEEIASDSKNVKEKSANKAEKTKNREVSGGRFDKPTGLAFDNNGNLLVSCAGAHLIHIFKFADGSHIGTIGRPGRGAGELNFPLDIDVSPDGRIAVADSGNRRVQIFSADGKFLLEKHYREETKKKELRSLAPYGVLWLNNNELLVSYPTFCQVVCFSGKTDDIVVWRYGVKGNDKGELNEPSYMCRTLSNTIMISDSKNHRIVEISKEGFFIRHISGRGTGAGRCISPKGLFMTPDEFLWLSDQGNNRIQIFRPSRIELILREAKSLISKDLWDEAFPLIEQAMNLNPNNPEALNLLVSSLHFFGDRCFRNYEYEKAEEYYRRILSYNPNDPEVQPKLDAVFWALNRPLIINITLGIAAIIVILIALWVTKMVFSRMLFAHAS